MPWFMACRAGDARRERAASEVEARQRHVEAPAFLVKPVLDRHLDVGEAGARLPRAPDTRLRTVLLEDVDAFHVWRADERRDALAGGARLRVGDRLLGHDGQHAGQGTRGGPLLLAVEDVIPAVVAELAAGLLPGCVRADGGLREAEGRKVLARHLRQEMALLRLGAEEHDGLTPDGLVRRDHHRRRRAIPADHLQDAVVAGHTEAQAVVLLGDRHAHHAEVEQALERPLRDVLLPVDLHRRVLVLEVGFELSEQGVALGPLLLTFPGIGKDEIVAKTSPEQVLDEPHLGRLRTQHGLGLLDHLAVSSGDVL